MDRAEKVGLSVAAAGHVVLFGLLSVGFLATPNPDKLKNQPVEVSLVPEVALKSAAPQPATEPAQSVAPEEGAPEDAAPSEPAPLEPAPPETRPAPPQPAPAPAPKPQPAPPKPAPAPKPAPKAAPKPPQQRPAAPAKPAPARPTPPKAAARPANASKPAPPTTKKGTGKTEIASAARPRGSRLGDDFLKGLSPEPSRATNPNPPAARVGQQEAANIASAIQRQIQPCANRQVSPGPGAERIRVAINLRMKPDGSLIGRPTIKGHTGVDDDNSRYVDRVDDLAVAAFTGCAPLRGLPPELYDVPGGWSNFTLRYKLPG